MKIDRNIVRQWINLTAIFAAFGINVLANIVPINGLSIGEISQNFFGEVLIIPANYAFAIWGLIYLGLISLAVYQALPVNKDNPELRKMGYFLAISSLAQIIWVVFFQYRLFALSVVAMVFILLPLIALYLRLEIALKPVSFQMKWFINFPISIYFGWISVATIVNVACALYFTGWNGWVINPVVWTVIMMVIGTILAIIVNLQRKDETYAGVFVWALVAITIRHLDIPIIAGTGGTLAVILVLSILRNKARTK
jgi:hypothetical protein